MSWAGRARVAARLRGDSDLARPFGRVLSGARRAARRFRARRQGAGLRRRTPGPQPTLGDSALHSGWLVTVAAAVTVTAATPITGIAASLVVSDDRD